MIGMLQGNWALQVAGTVLGGMLWTLISAASNEGRINYCLELTHLEGRKARIEDWISGARIVQEDLVSHRFDIANKKTGGFLDLGLCWWRSRLQRNSILLAYFEPQMPRPTYQEAKEIFKKLSRSNQVVAIPGFSNFLAFSSYYEREMIEVLEAWQWRNVYWGGMRTGNPLRPTFYIKTETLFEQVQYAKEQLEEFGSIPYLMLQIPGITAHSWLVLKVEEITRSSSVRFGQHHPTSGDHKVVGYRMFVSDPASGSLFADIYPDTKVVTEVYAARDTKKSSNLMKKGTPSKKPFPFYVDWMVDLQKAEQAIKTACGRNTDRTLAPDPRSLGYSFEATYR